MKPVCEIIVKEILPSVRAIVAKRLMESYSLSQEEVAERLGTSQPAISQYKRGLRGYKIKIFEENSELFKMVDELTKKILRGASIEKQTTEFCKICKYAREQGIIKNLKKK